MAAAAVADGKTTATADAAPAPAPAASNGAAAAGTTAGATAVVDPKAPKCQAPGCSNPANQQCPTCQKLSLPPSHYCSQACFKKAWGEHNQVHKGRSTDQLQRGIERTRLTH